MIKRFTLNLLLGFIESTTLILQITAGILLALVLVMSITDIAKGAEETGSLYFTPKGTCDAAGGSYLFPEYTPPSVKLEHVAEATKYCQSRTDGYVCLQDILFDKDTGSYLLGCKQPIVEQEQPDASIQGSSGRDS